MAEALHVIHPELGTLVFRRGPLGSSEAVLNDADNLKSCFTGGEFSPDSEGCSNPGTQLDITHIFLSQKQIGKGRIGRIYRGSVQPSKSSSNIYPRPDTPLVLKLVFPQGRLNGRKLYPKGYDGQELLADLAKEAAMYALMHEIQGEVVPRCFGYYCNDAAGCLVLEDCGEDLKFPYRRLPLQERRALFELQKRLHQVGVSHGDIARRNFVKGPRGIRLLDFDRAALHTCQGFEDPTFKAGIAAAELDNNVCPELRKLFRAFGLLPMEYYSLAEQKAYEPWDGEPWSL